LCAAAACSPTSAQHDATRLAHSGSRDAAASAPGATIGSAGLGASASNATQDATKPAAAHDSSTSSAARPTSALAFERALLISVDGLRSDALQAVPGSELPNFRRMLNGAATLNARTDPDYTITLPNHTSMITGRPVLGPDGHGWIENDDAAPGATLHKNHGSYVACMFDVAHDRGFHTALFSGKTKFAIYDASYDAENGAPPVSDSASNDAATNAAANAPTNTAGRAAGASAEHAADAARGRKKIDTWKYVAKIEDIADLVIANLSSVEQRSLVFAHFALTDLTGHEHGWDVTPRSRYMRAVASVDRELGRILDAVQSNSALHGKTVIVLTADHGGGAPFRSHDQSQMWVDYIIPFLVWSGDGGARADLYALNADTRRDPGLSSPRLADPGLPPIRNGDAGNLLLSLLGLPPVPGSVFDAKQDLRIR
jgi:hypothetical protein